MSVSRLGYVNIKVQNLKSAVEHYTDIVGLRVVAYDRAGRAYLQSADNQDHHCLVLTEADRPGLAHVGYKVNDVADLDALSQGLAARGITVREIPANEILGQGRSVGFDAGSGHEFVFYYHADKIGYATGMRNPDSVGPHSRVGTTHIDHLVLSCERLSEFVALLSEVFGFYITEQITTPNGELAVAFLSCSNKMHDLALLVGPNGGFHHVAFGLESRSDVISRTDVLRQREIPTLELGITRHGIAGVTTVYARDPSGNLYEFFHGVYVAPGVGGNVPAVTWPPETSERGLFYYEGAVPSAFMSRLT